MASKNPNWFQKLVDIQVFSSLKSLKINIGEINLIKIVNKPIEKQTNTDRVLLIDWSKLSDKQKKELKSSLPLAFKEGAGVLEAEYINEVNDYEKTIKNGNDLVNFFEDKIPEADLYALKASIYIKKIFDKGKDIQSLKKDLRYKYGQRGINISNLYSAKYFETWIKPLYESSKNKDSFLEAYNLTVEQSPFAIFVHASMPIREIKTTVKEKIEECRQYGIKVVNVHGIGTENITKIVQAMNELKNEMNLSVNYETFSVFVAKIEVS